MRPSSSQQLWVTGKLELRSVNPIYTGELCNSSKTGHRDNDRARRRNRKVSRNGDIFVGEHALEDVGGGRDGDAGADDGDVNGDGERDPDQRDRSSPRSWPRWSTVLW